MQLLYPTSSVSHFRKMDHTSFEELRRQYRAEAIQACVAAEQRGYEKAYAKLSLNLSTLSEECEALKKKIAILNQVKGIYGADRADIKTIMEQVYRNLKLQFETDDDAPLLISRFKTALRQATVELSASSSETAPRDKNLPDNISSAEACVIRIVPRAPPILLSVPHRKRRMIFYCSIDGYVLNSSTGLFGSKFASYNIRTDIRPFSVDGEKTVVVARRFSDFVAFEARLRNAFPRCILPVLPPKEASIQTTDAVVQRRLRYLNIWLRYVAHHIDMSQVPCFGQFISDQVDDTYFVIDASFNQKNFIDSNKCETYLKKSQYRRANKPDMPAVWTERGKFDSVNTLELVNRDYRLLAHNMIDTLISSKRFDSSLTSCAGIARHLESSLQELLGVDDAQTDTSIIIFLSQTVHVMENYYSFWSIHFRTLMDTVRFFGQPCMESAKSLIDRSYAHETCSDSSADIILALAVDWNQLREFRQAELYKCVLNYSVDMRTETATMRHDIESQSQELAGIIEYSANMVNSFKESCQAQTLQLELLYEELSTRVAVTIEKTKFGLNHVERVSLPQGVRRAPVKIFQRIKPELNITVDYVGVESTPDTVLCTAEGDDKISSPSMGYDGHNNIHEYDDNMTVEEANNHKPRRNKFGGSVASITPHLRHRQQLNKKSTHAISSNPLCSKSETSATENNFLAQSYAAQVSSSRQADCPKQTDFNNVAQKKLSDLPRRQNGLNEVYSWGDGDDSSTCNHEAQHRKTSQILTDKEDCNLTRRQPYGGENVDTGSDSDEVFQKSAISVTDATDWEEVRLPDSQGGGVYYYHKKTRISRWDRPDDNISAALEARLMEEQKRVDLAVQRRKKEILENVKLQEDRAIQYDLLQHKIQGIIAEWLKPPRALRERNIVELLNTVSEIVPMLKNDTFASSEYLTRLSVQEATPDQVRKCYMRIVRLIHPDKISTECSNEDRFLAKAAFVALTESYQKYMDSKRGSSS